MKTEIYSNGQTTYIKLYPENSFEKAVCDAIKPPDEMRTTVKRIEGGIAGLKIEITEKIIPKENLENELRKRHTD